MDELNRIWEMEALRHTNAWKASFLTAPRAYCEPLEEKDEGDILSLKRHDNGYTAQWISDWEPVLYGDKWVRAKSIAHLKGTDVKYIHGRTVSGFNLIRLTVQ